MALKHTLFGSVDSRTNLHLIQTSVDIGTASPKWQYTSTIMRDGSSVSPSGASPFQRGARGVKLATRTITWNFTAEPGYYSTFLACREAVNNALNGRKLNIYINDSTKYYIGYVNVKSQTQDGTLFTFSVEATCEPYAYKSVTTTISYNGTTATDVDLSPLGVWDSNAVCLRLTPYEYSLSDTDDDIYIKTWDGVTSSQFDSGYMEVGDNYLYKEAFYLDLVPYEHLQVEEGHNEQGAFSVKLKIMVGYMEG